MDRLDHLHHHHHSRPERGGQAFQQVMEDFVPANAPLLEEIKAIRDILEKVGHQFSNSY